MAVGETGYVACEFRAETLQTGNPASQCVALGFSAAPAFPSLYDMGFTPADGPHGGVTRSGVLMNAPYTTLAGDTQLRTEIQTAGGGDFYFLPLAGFKVV